MKVRQIASVVAADFGVSIDQMCSPQRSFAVRDARHITWFLASRHCGLRLSDISRAVGKFDHSSVRHGINRVKAMIAQGGDLADRIVKLDALLGAPATAADRDASFKDLQMDLEKAEEHIAALQRQLVLANTTPLEPLVRDFLLAQQRLDDERYTQTEAFARRAADKAFMALKDGFLATRPAPGAARRLKEPKHAQH